MLEGIYRHSVKRRHRRHSSAQPYGVFGVSGLRAFGGRGFDEIVQRRLQSNGWGCDPGAADYLREVCAARGGDLRPCYPRDIFNIVASIAEFEERAPVLTRSDVDRAADLYYGISELAAA